MTPANLALKQSSYMDSVRERDTAAETDPFTKTQGEPSMMNQDSPVRYNKKKHLTTSVFKSNNKKIMELDEGMARITEFREARQSGGKTYLRNRTLTKGCPHLVRMVE